MQPNARSVREGYAPFSPVRASKSCYTWYRIYGELPTIGIEAAGKFSILSPLIIVHGGPAAGHQSLLALLDLHERHNIPMIFYDQIGANQSTHLDELAGDSSFWVPSLFVAELENLIEHLHLTRYSVLGHSWGGILSALWAGTTSPRGLEKLILSCTIASGSDRADELDRLVDEMPDLVKETLRRCQGTGDFTSEDFRSALVPFMRKHVNTSWDEGDALERIKMMTTDVGHVFKHLYGNSIMHMSGHIKTIDLQDTLKNISARTLLINGEYDNATDACMRPFFQNIQRVKWITIGGAAHEIYLERPERYMQICSNFLLD